MSDTRNDGMRDLYTIHPPWFVHWVYLYLSWYTIPWFVHQPWLVNSLAHLDYVCIMVEHTDLTTWELFANILLQLQIPEMLLDRHFQTIHALSMDIFLVIPFHKLWKHVIWKNNKAFVSSKSSEHKGGCTKGDNQEFVGHLRWQVFYALQALLILSNGIKMVWVMI